MNSDAKSKVIIEAEKLIEVLRKDGTIPRRHVVKRRPGEAARKCRVESSDDESHWYDGLDEAQIERLRDQESEKSKIHSSETPHFEPGCFCQHPGCEVEVQDNKRKRYDCDTCDRMCYKPVCGYQICEICNSKAIFSWTKKRKVSEYIHRLWEEEGCRLREEVDSTERTAAFGLLKGDIVVRMREHKNNEPK